MPVVLQTAQRTSCRQQPQAWTAFWQRLVSQTGGARGRLQPVQSLRARRQTRSGLSEEGCACQRILKGELRVAMASVWVPTQLASHGLAR